MGRIASSSFFQCFGVLSLGTPLTDLAHRDSSLSFAPAVPKVPWRTLRFPVLPTITLIVLARTFSLAALLYCMYTHSNRSSQTQHIARPYLLLSKLGQVNGRFPIYFRQAREGSERCRLEGDEGVV